MKLKLIILMILTIAAFALALTAAVLQWDIVCPVSLLFTGLFALAAIFDDPELLGYCSHIQPYGTYYPFII